MIISRKRMDEEVNKRVKEELEQEYKSRKLYELQKEIDELRAQMETIRAEQQKAAEQLNTIGEQLTDGISNMLDAIDAWGKECDGDDVLVWTESAKKE